MNVQDAPRRKSAFLQRVSVQHRRETAQHRRRRYFSLLVVNLALLVVFLGRSITITGTYPYLLQLDPGIDKTFLGWVGAVGSFGQLIASPLFGYLTRKLKNVRILFLCSMLLFVIGFAIYACLGAFPHPKQIYMLLARFLIGASVSILALTNSYTAMSTTLSERTTAVAVNFFSLCLGFTVGSGLQSAMVPLAEANISIPFGPLVLDTFTAAAWIALVTGLLSLLLFLPVVFKECIMSEYEEKRMTRRRSSVHEVVLTNRKNWLGLTICFLIYCSPSITTTVAESIGTPLIMDQLAMSNTDAVRWFGIIASISSVVSTLTYPVTAFLSTRMNDSKILILFGVIPTVVSDLWFLPYAGPTPKMQETLEITNIVLLDGTNHTVEPSNNIIAALGCPLQQEWCPYTPALHSYQMITGVMIGSVGWAVSGATSCSLVTKLSDPGQRGIMMGLLSAALCVVRMIFSLCFAYLYSEFGTWAVFSLSLANSVTLLVLTVVFRTKLQVVDSHRAARSQTKAETPSTAQRKASLCSGHAVFYIFESENIKPVDFPTIELPQGICSAKTQDPDIVIEQL